MSLKPAVRLWFGLIIGVIASLSIATTQVEAQADFPFNLQRATNLARMKAETLNGGLNLYRPDACMYDRSAGDCLVESNDEGVLFRFLGGAPGWQQLELPASFETELLISADGREVLEVIYNGPVRITP
ncbi:hypothetical protein KQ302_12505 [Synechococcus sp. CS-602]|uniref:hypothetical protein n=1 Tax=Synechococcaceae TaxID=1890426 RepID=UPI0008FF21A7|nr:MULTISPECIES: hypothetical protein [Synechococcaceae]MCT4363924.1 hypothetical protein [Candidatus Regnicoccus frigidus MAG-AL1]APD48452.1 hypothetical protein BM449_09670 [Synechococcus sp. SynAce01]MCT0201360.1 hypothetical protein [Synechococcus sp. CS-603]MCT0205910.1 hypothetical protein [Synechococcus sp. CS-602]MCT0246016.1 hypothetical protein [Synechococcus sp. CS-601]